MNKTQTARFEKWYKVFPNRVSRGDGEKAWESLDPDDDLTTKMILAVEAQIRYRAECKKTNEFCPRWKGPGPWIRQLCWKDEVGSHAELKAKQESKVCCLEGCTSQTMGARFQVCEHHFQHDQAGRLLGHLGLVAELRNKYIEDTTIQNLRGQDALKYIKRKIVEIGR